MTHQEIREETYVIKDNLIDYLKDSGLFHVLAYTRKENILLKSKCSSIIYHEKMLSDRIFIQCGRIGELLTFEKNVFNYDFYVELYKFLIKAEEHYKKILRSGKIIKIIDTI